MAKRDGGGRLASSLAKGNVSERLSRPPVQRSSWGQTPVARLAGRRHGHLRRAQFELDPTLPTWTGFLNPRVSTVES